ncbi:Uncharacterised protein [Mycobacteroides abscessus subsp. abscessus]|nr:Uncharacterised protein [Mycobacteroides abscessus subsp. abscessus]
MSTAPPHSPPTPNPWISRSTTSNTGAHMPICWEVGSRPTAKVAAPISSSATTSIFLRPIRSPKCPMTMPPSGRATKPTAKVANDRMVASQGSTPEKNKGANTTAADAP